MSVLEVYCECRGIKSVYKGFQTKGAAIDFARRSVKSIVDQAILIEDSLKIDEPDNKRFKILFRNPDYAICWLDNNK